MKPKFTICRLGAQDRVPNVDTIITDNDFTNICRRLTGNTIYDVEWVNKRIKGKLFTLETEDNIYYITYTPKVVGGRNSYLQSVPTAYGLYLKELNKSKKNSQFCLYFTEFRGENQTRYHKFIYRLLVSIGVYFINSDEGLRGFDLQEYNKVDELIADRNANRSRNSDNQSTYITDEGNSYHIYGKTFGANQKETTLLCFALCKVSDKPIRLFQISDNESDYLSQTDIKSINYFSEKFGKARIEILDDTYEFVEYRERSYVQIPAEQSLRSPRFIFNLLEKTGGHKCCSLCHCKIESIIQGAHIFPVYAIKQRSDLTFPEKLQMATDKDNGIWLCDNHHKLFDRGLIKFNNGKLQIMAKLNLEDKEFVDRISPNKEIEKDYYNSAMDKYFKMRDDFYRTEKYY